MGEAAQRTCGDCGMCCKLMGVAAIAKPAHSWCGHFRKGGGCGVYDSRPRACADFTCYWLRAPNLDDRWRPDRARFVLHQDPESQALVVEVDPASPEAWRRAPYYETFKTWSARGLTQGRALNVLVGRRGYEILPDRDVDHGQVRELPA